MSTQQDVTSDTAPVGTFGRFRAALRGWVGFAGLMLLMAGGLNVIWGLVALENKDYFAAHGPAWSTVTTWGWVLLIAGVFQIIAAVLVFGRQETGQVLAVMLCCLAILAHFLTLGANTAWSIIVIAANALVLWAVTTHEDEFN
jgi:uncharacterized membrane protein HdeD (DUF308 family)